MGKYLVVLRIIRVASMPFIFGISISIRQRSYSPLFFFAYSMASMPFEAISKSKPQPFISVELSFCMIGLSSAINILMANTLCE